MTVAALYRYPVKSMLGEAPQRVVLGPRGVVGDRAYALLDVATGDVASAKVPRRWSRLLDFAARFTTEPMLDEPPPPVLITFPDGSVHRSDDRDIDAALSSELGREVRLLTEAPTDGGFEEVWPDIEGLAPQQIIDATESRREDTGEVVSRFGLSAFGPDGAFFDLAAVHVLTEATLARLGELAPGPTFDARRYRPNVVLGDTDPGFVENDWPGRTTVLGDAVHLRYQFVTMRCVMTTLGQRDLAREPDTLRAIARHNRLSIPQFGDGLWACAGIYADVEQPGAVAVGDPSRTE